MIAQPRVAEVSARLASVDHALLTRAFPFSHELTVSVRLDEQRLRITTVLTATGDAAVPVAFGWHPYFRLPHAPRRERKLRLPARTEFVLGPDQLPTGEQRDAPGENAAIGARTFDDLYALGRDRRFVLEGGERRLVMTLDGGYPYAQIYAPPRAQFACIEPMTAPVNALGTAHATLVAPGDHYVASFTIAIR